MQYCYLCGKPIEDGRNSGDHVVPKSLIQRKQPKVKGCDYAGELPTHEDCNNRFGPEIYVTKAIQLLGVLASNDGVLIRQHRQEPDIKIMAWDASKLEGFTERDLRFFKMIDVREEDYETFTNPDFLKGKQKTNAVQKATSIALSVLVKSAAAILVKRKIFSVPKKWKIYAVPYFGASSTTDFDNIMGETKPFDIGVKAWVKLLEQKNWLVLYKADTILVFFVFSFSVLDPLKRLRRTFPDAEIFRFFGTSIRDLLTRGWVKV
jgi:hypothetical protein